jgi:hypothetical protein
VPVDRTAFLLRVPAGMAVAAADRAYSLGMSRQAWVRSVLAAALANSGDATCGVECRVMTEAYGVVHLNDTC